MSIELKKNPNTKQNKEKKSGSASKPHFHTLPNYTSLLQQGYLNYILNPTQPYAVPIVRSVPMRTFVLGNVISVFLFFFVFGN